MAETRHIARLEAEALLTALRCSSNEHGYFAVAGGRVRIEAVAVG